MNMFYILVFFITISNIVFSQNFAEQGKDTVINIGKYKVSLNVITNTSDYFSDDDAIYSSSNPIAIKDFEQAKNMLKEKVKFNYSKSKWSDDAFIDNIIVENGMKIIIKWGSNFQTYYPNEKIIVFGHSNNWIFNIKNGEQEYEPIFTKYSENSIFRSVKAFLLSYYNPALIIQTHNTRSNKFDDLINLSELFDYDFDFESNIYFWKNNCFYMYTKNNLWEIKISK